MRRSSSRPPVSLTEAAVQYGAAFFGSLFLLLVALGVSAVVLVTNLTSARQSAYTQAHGVPRTATVTSVIVGGPRAGTEDVNVALTDPVDGQQTVTVLVPSVQSFPVGARVRILVDPQDPGDAEMVGQQFKTDSDAFLGASLGWAAAAILVVLVIIAGRGWRKARRGDDVRPL